jgi:protein-S-isoprenylcysteine O-methyltransferase Ste14
MKKSRILPPTYLLLAIVAMVVVHFAVPITTIIPTPWNLLGLIPLGIGMVLNTLADRAFHEAETTVKPFEASAALLTDGVFSMTRHPMYVGFVMILLGLALLLRSLMPFAIVVIFGVFIDRAFIRIEEEMLREQFGEAWETYTSQARRWI